MILGIVVGFFLFISLFANSMGVISLYRFPDVYTRIHGVAKCTTFGTLFAVIALLIYSFVRFLEVGENRFLVFFIHVFIAGAVLLFTNPNGIYVLARSIYRSGVMPEPSIVDALAEAEKLKKLEGETEE